MLEGYYFNDCVLIDLTVAPDLSGIQIVSEVQYVCDSDPKGRLGHIKIRLTNIEEVQLRLLPGFHNDLNYAYGYKGNEIYELSFENTPDGKLNLTLRSDFLSLTATCPASCCQHFLMS